MHLIKLWVTRYRRILWIRFSLQDPWIRMELRIVKMHTKSHKSFSFDWIVWQPAYFKVLTLRLWASNRSSWMLIWYSRSELLFTQNPNPRLCRRRISVHLCWRASVKWTFSRPSFLFYVIVLSWWKYCTPKRLY